MYLDFHKVGYGTFQVLWYGRGFNVSPTRKGISHDTLAIDRIKDDNLTPRMSRYGYTLKQAYESLYNCTNPC